MSMRSNTASVARSARMITIQSGNVTCDHIRAPQIAKLQTIVRAKASPFDRR